MPAEIDALPPTAGLVIAFFGMFGVGNIGNEASLRAVLQGLRRLAPTAEFSCICPGPEAAAHEHGIPCSSSRAAGPLNWLRPRNPVARVLVRPLVEPFRWWSSIRTLRRIDAVVIPGTGILEDYCIRPWGMPFELFRWALCCRLTGTRLCFVSVGAAPVRNRLSRFFVMRAVGLSTYCSYRDQRSRECMARSGRSTEGDPVVPDAVFSLAAPVANRPKPGPTRIGLGVMAYRGMDGGGARGDAIYGDYVRRLAELIGLLQNSGCVVSLLVGDAQDDEVRVDLSALQATASGRHLPAGSPMRAPNIDSMEALMREMALTDGVIVSRFHNVVGALMVGRPVVSLSYSFKNSDLLESFNLRHCHSPIEEFEPLAAAEMLHGLMAEWSQHEGSVADTTSRFAQTLDTQLQSVLSCLAGGRAMARRRPLGTAGTTPWRRSGR